MSNYVLEERDCTALNELISFAAALDDEVTITFVGGGEEDLARWITGLISATPLVQTDMVLLQDITLWELFLTKAGMNAFAAQAVLSELKAPQVGEDGGEELATTGQRVGQGERYGLAAFVTMEEGERMERFGRLFGGRKVLETVGRVLDGGWRGVAPASELS